MSETRALADFVATIEFSDLPPALVEKARIYILDDVAAGFIGSLQPWTRSVAQMVGELGGRPEATCFNQRLQTDVARAALVNGAAIGAFESEHIGHTAHPSATVFPAALAIAERNHRPGQDLLTALLLGYEVVCRIGEAQTPAVEVERGFHNPGVNGTFGAAAATGKLLGLDALRLAWALGIAGSSSSGIVEFVWEGAMTKRIHLGRASQLGLESALLAQRGVTGPTTVLEGPYGFLHAFSPRPQLEKLLYGLGERWLAEELTIKAYPVHSTAQAIVHAVLRHRATRPLDPAEVRRVTVITRGHAPERRYLDTTPTTMLGAQYSLPYSVAMALGRDLSDPVTLSDDVLRDEMIRKIATRVEVRSEPERFARATDHVTAEIEIEMDGERRRFSVDSFPGSPTQPLDFAGACDKLRRYARYVSTPERVSLIIEHVRNLERLDDVSELAALLASP